MNDRKSQEGEHGLGGKRNWDRKSQEFSEKRAKAQRSFEELPTKKGNESAQGLCSHQKKKNGPD